MNTPARIMLLIFLSGVITPAFLPAKSQVKGVKAELICEASTITAGQTFTVALFLHHFDGFHTYWRNPGNVGVPTTIKWHLPEGFKAGEIQWQVPERSKMLEYHCHGYKGDTYLLVDITAPAVLPDGPITLTAESAWMSCSQRTCCFLAFEKFPVTVSGGKTSIPHPEHAKQIAEARKRLPTADPDWTVTASAEKTTFSIRITHPTKEIPDEALYFFPFEKVTDTEAAQVTTTKDRTYTLTATRSELLDTTPDRLEGLLYNPAGWGDPKQKHLLINAPVVDQNSGNSSR